MKITKRIDESVPKITDETPNSGFNLSRRIDDLSEQELKKVEDATPPVHNALENFSDPVSSPINSDWESVAYRLTQLLGEEVLTRIRQYPLSQIAYIDADTTLISWLIEVLRTLMKQDDIQDISRHLDQTFGTMEHQLVQLNHTCHEQKEENERLLGQAQQLQEKVDELEGARIRSNRLLRTRITIDSVIDAVFDARDATESSFIEILKNDLVAAPDDLGAFTLALSKAWRGLKKSVQQLPIDADEDRRLTQLSESLRELLTKLSGLYVTARRGVLNAIAHYASTELVQYEFVSPEETKLVNPAIHSTDALGGSVILEGVTFAVLKRDTRQTVRYAEVKVEKI